MQEILDAINRLDNALNEAAARDAALDLGEAIGNYVGAAMYVNKRTPEQINAMSWPDMTAWSQQVKDNPPA